jgi:NAD/NADP transhydrogenase beta subunit
MPILNVDQAEAMIVMKRSMKPGFAGIENELFYDPKTRRCSATPRPASASWSPR